MAWSAGLLQIKELKIFPMELGFMRNWEFFKWGGGGSRLFHNGWGNFRVVETFTRSDVFSFSCRLRFYFFWWRGGGGSWYFSRSLRFLMGLRFSQWLEFLVRMFVIFQVVAGGLTFFLEVIHFLGGGGYILKLAFSHDEVLSCILQNALNCSLK